MQAASTPVPCPSCQCPCSNPAIASHPKLSHGQGQGPHSLFSAHDLWLLPPSGLPGHARSHLRDQPALLSARGLVPGTDTWPLLCPLRVSSVICSVAFPSHLYGTAIPASHPPRPSSPLRFSLFTRLAGHTVFISAFASSPATPLECAPLEDRNGSVCCIPSA